MSAEVKPRRPHPSGAAAVGVRRIRHCEAASNPIAVRTQCLRMARRLIGRLTVGMISVATVSVAADHDVPLFPSASDPDRHGFVRIINHTSRPGSIRLHAIDDDGSGIGPLELSIDANAVLHFNSGDLENGNPAKGLDTGTGPGNGDWRLELASDLDIEVLAYIRTGDGFLASMHEVVGIANDGRHWLGLFNPADSADPTSRLRLVNAGPDAVDVTITGIDDEGTDSGEVVVSVPAGASRTFTAQELESGGMFKGALGDGSGKWRLFLSPDGPITVMNLMESPTGALVTLASAPSSVDEQGIHRVPLFPGTSDDSGMQGLVRVINLTDLSGSLAIDASDESDTDYEPLALTLDAHGALQFDAEDLETGDAELGLSAGIGPGSGDWRLGLSSDLDIDVLPYIRADNDGLPTPMFETVPGIGNRHRVAIFNPGSNRTQVSQLRLVNRASVAANVTITGLDDRATSPGAEVELSVPVGEVETLTAQELEAGREDFEGNLGDGAGKWRLLIEADAPIEVMNLLASPTGHLTNLSSVPTNFAPSNTPAFYDRVDGKRIVQGDGNRYIDFTSAGRYRETGDGGTTVGSYKYNPTGRATGSIVLEPDDGDSCTVELNFESRISGRLSGCDADADPGWRLLVPVRHDDGRGTYEITAMIATLPSGTWTPDVVRGAEVSVAGGIVRLELANGDYVEVGEYRYTCRDAGGCVIEDRILRVGRILETPALAVRDFDLAQDNRASTGLAYGEGHFFLVDAADRKVYVYDGSGKHIPPRDFDLAPDTHTAAGIAFGDGRLYVVDELDILEDESLRRVFVYDSLGQPLEDAGFELHAANLEPLGIAHADGTLFVADARTRKVYAYSTVAERLTDAEFDLHADNFSPRGIAHGNDRFHVVDIFDDKVYVYRKNGERDADRDFELVGGNYFGQGIEVVDNRFFVVDSRRVYAYPTDRPDLVIEAFFVDDTRPQPGASFTLRATVRNIGHRRSAPAKLSHYRSMDAFIGVSDEAIGDGDLGSIAVEAAVRTTVDVEAPERSGHYYYGACVDVLVEESDLDNCSEAIRVTVPVDAGGATAGFVLDSDNANATGIAYADDRFHIVDSEDRKVYAYRTTAERDPDLDFALDADNTGAVAIVYANERFYVADRADDKVYAYGVTGERDADADFDLDDDNASPNGIAYGDDRFYIADLSDGKIYVYRTSGSRIASADFDLSQTNDTPWAMEFVEDRLYVIDNVDDAVYVYQTTGDRDTALEFPLDADNASPEGIALFDGRFYVPDHYDDKVYGYAIPENTDPAAEPLGVTNSPSSPAPPAAGR